MNKIDEFRREEAKRIELTKVKNFSKGQKENLLAYKNRYDELSALTKNACLGCKSKFSCCQPGTCLIVKEELAELGIFPLETGHTRGVYNSENGCTLDPYLRQMCSDFLCDWARRVNPGLNVAFENLKDDIIGVLWEELREEHQIDPILGVYRVLSEADGGGGGG